MIAFYQYIDAVLSLPTIPTICTLKASISSQIGLYSPLIVRPESNPKLASVSLPVATLHRRTILSRRLTFKAINVTHDIESAFVGVA